MLWLGRVWLGLFKVSQGWSRFFRVWSRFGYGESGFAGVGQDCGLLCSRLVTVSQGQKGTVRVGPVCSRLFQAG